MKIIIMHLVFFSTVKCSGKEDFIRFNIFYYVATLVPSWVWTPDLDFMKFTMLVDRFTDILLCIIFFSTCMGVKSVFFFNLAVFAHLTLPIALKGLQSQSFHKLDSLTIKMFYTANGINRPCSFQKEYFLKKNTQLYKKKFSLQNGIPY